MSAARKQLRERVIEELRQFGVDDPYGEDAKALLAGGWALVFEDNPTELLRQVQVMVDNANSRIVEGGQIRVIMRRMDALQDAIAQRGRGDRSDPQLDVEWCYDQVLRALTKAFGLPR